MPRPDKLIQYPKQWLDLVSAVSAGGRSVAVKELAGKPLTLAAACKLRFRFYGFRSLLRKDAMQQDLAQLSEMVECSLEHIPNTDFYIVHFRSRDMNPEGLALQDALGGQ